MSWREMFRSLDWVLAGASLLLVLLGLAMMVSSSTSTALFSGLALRQGLALAVSLAVTIVIIRIPYHAWRRWALVVYSLGLAGLVTVTLIGQTIRGTVSRLEFFGWQLQPSEFMKLGIVTVLAWVFTRYQAMAAKALLLSAAFVLPAVGLVLAEPDAGMAGLLIATWIGLLAFSGLPWKYIVGIGVIGILVLIGSWQTILLDYQKDRIRTFLDPQADPLAAGYNVTQSIIAFGSGGILGRGLGHGPQSQLKFLPERHTDFILASLGEELGFIGTTLVVMLYSVLLWRILKIARSTNDIFGQLLAIGIFFVFLTSFIVSAGMNTGLLPVTGIPFPLLSYGGSNLLTTFVLLAIVQSIHVHSRFVQKTPPEITGII